MIFVYICRLFSLINNVQAIRLMVKHSDSSSSIRYFIKLIVLILHRTIQMMVDVDHADRLSCHLTGQ
jgi:hypothetical protein